MAQSNNSSVYEKTKKQLYEILWENFLENITVGDLLTLYWKKYGTRVPRCGYWNEVELMHTMTDAIKFSEKLGEPTYVTAIIQQEDILFAKEGVRRAKKGSADVKKPDENKKQTVEKELSQNMSDLKLKTSPMSEKDRVLDNLKKEFRALLTTSKKEHMTGMEIMTSHRKLFGTRLPCRYQELFGQMPDVMEKIPGSDHYKLVPSEKSAHLRKMVVEEGRIQDIKRTCNNNKKPPSQKYLTMMNNVKKDIRAILTIAKKPHMSRQEIIDYHKSLYRSPLPCSYEELFARIPDVLQICTDWFKIKTLLMCSQLFLKKTDSKMQYDSSLSAIARVPIQYPRHLAFIVSQYLHGGPNHGLNNRLFIV